jgi:DNA-binding transcriptional regulator YhcF (GntR family)
VELDRDSDIPLGVQLGWSLRARIGGLDAGARLPGVRELAAEAGVNVNTVRAVYSRLEAEGLIRVEHGRGTFVAEQSPSGDRVAAVAQSAREAATAAGIDPRDLAAALYANPSPADDSARRRRKLRADIAELEAELAAEVAKRAVRDKSPGDLPRGGRLLDEQGLRAQRDELMVRLRELREPPTAKAAERRTSSATRPGVAYRLRLT